MTVDVFAERTKRYNDIGVYVLWLLLDTEKQFLNKNWIGWLDKLYFGRVYYWAEKLEIKARCGGIFRVEAYQDGKSGFYPKTFNLLFNFNINT